jgi:hypothetical protein
MHELLQLLLHHRGSNPWIYGEDWALFPPWVQGLEYGGGREGMMAAIKNG